MFEIQIVKCIFAIMEISFGLGIDVLSHKMTHYNLRVKGCPQKLRFTLQDVRRYITFPFGKQKQGHAK